MAGNAHRNRHGNVATCTYCQHRASEGKRLQKFRNKNGNRHNPTHKRRGRRNRAKTTR